MKCTAIISQMQQYFKSIIVNRVSLEFLNAKSRTLTKKFTVTTAKHWQCRPSVKQLAWLVLVSLESAQVDSTYAAANRMSKFYDCKKHKIAQEFNIGDTVSIGIPKIDRTSTDLPRLPCVVVKIHGEKVLSYFLEYGQLASKFHAGDLTQFTGTVSANLWVCRFLKAHHHIKGH